MLKNHTFPRLLIKFPMIILYHFKDDLYDSDDRISRNNGSFSNSPNIQLSKYINNRKFDPDSYLKNLVKNSNRLNLESIIYYSLLF